MAFFCVCVCALGSQHMCFANMSVASCHKQCTDPYMVKYTEGSLCITLVQSSGWQQAAECIAVSQAYTSQLSINGSKSQNMFSIVQLTESIIQHPYEHAVICKTLTRDVRDVLFCISCLDHMSNDDLVRSQDLCDAIWTSSNITLIISLSWTWTTHK